MKVLIFGARGGLGRMVAAALRQRQVRLVLAGRELHSLYAVAEPDDECRVGDLDSQLAGVQVVVNCAPLDRRRLDSLVEASLKAGAHFLDTGGEQSLIQHLLDDYATATRDRGLSLIPALGLDYALGDCLARLAGAELQPCREIQVAYAFSAGSAENSLAFATSARRGAEVVYRGGKWRPVPLELDWGRVDFPPPFGRQQVARYGSGEVVCVPRHTQVGAMKTWILASSLAPHPALLPLFPILRPLITKIMRTPLRAWIAWLANRLRPAPGQTTPAQAQAQAIFPPCGPAFAIVVVATGAKGGQCRLTATGSDCYATTAEVVAQGVQEVLAGKVPPGALSPAMAFAPAPFLNALRPHLQWG